MLTLDVYITSRLTNKYLPRMWHILYVVCQIFIFRRINSKEHSICARKDTKTQTMGACRLTMQSLLRILKIENNKWRLNTMKMQNDVRVTVRVEKELKEQADDLFNRLGMNMSTAMNVFLRKAVEESAIPFQVSVKNTAVGAGSSPADITDAFENAVQKEIEESQRKGHPVARYDAKKKLAYLEFSDGSREYING